MRWIDRALFVLIEFQRIATTGSNSIFDFADYIYRDLIFIDFHELRTFFLCLHAAHSANRVTAVRFCAFDSLAMIQCDAFETFTFFAAAEAKWKHEIWHSGFGGYKLIAIDYNWIMVEIMDARSCLLWSDLKGW